MFVFSILQLCQWHKRENVVRCLQKAQAAAWRRWLQQGLRAPDVCEARTVLGQLCQERRALNVSAVASLDEGLEETLTPHRLGLFPTLGVSLKSTNWLESLNAQLGQLTDKVDHWRTAEQKHRWVASALLLIKPRLR
jgi:putative transposase